ncbi:MAG: hypothetical protein WC421_02560 [Elusimicrobiales bacterium]
MRKIIYAISLLGIMPVITNCYATDTSTGSRLQKLECTVTDSRNDMEKRLQRMEQTVENFNGRLDDVKSNYANNIMGIGAMAGGVIGGIGVLAALGIYFSFTGMKKEIGQIDGKVKKMEENAKTQIESLNDAVSKVEKEVHHATARVFSAYAEIYKDNALSNVVWHMRGMSEYLQTGDPQTGLIEDMLNRCEERISRDPKTVYCSEEENFKCKREMLDVIEEVKKRGFGFKDDKLLGNLERLIETKIQVKPAGEASTPS